jgi:hypothetical protein
LLGCSLIAAYKCREQVEKEKNKTKIFNKLSHNFFGWSEPKKEQQEQRGYFGCIYEKTAKYVGYSICIVGSIFVVGVGLGVSLIDPQEGAKIISYPVEVISQIKDGLRAFNSEYFQPVSNLTAVAQTPTVAQTSAVEKKPTDASPFDVKP